MAFVRPKSIYGNGVDKEWWKTTKEDYYTPQLAKIGMQDIENREIYVDDTGPTDVFGYEPRYEEYRRANSRISGEFRGATLDDWHLARIFSSDVALNSTFKTCTPADRIYQSTATDGVYCMFYNSVQARRPIEQNGHPNPL